MRDALLTLAAGLAAFLVCIAAPAYFIAEYVTGSLSGVTR